MCCDRKRLHGLKVVCSLLVVTAGIVLSFGETVPRIDRSKLLVGAYCFRKAAYDDPYDKAPARRALVFRAQEGLAVEAFGTNGPLELTREADGSFSFPICENAAVMLVCRRVANTAR